MIETESEIYLSDSISSQEQQKSLQGKTRREKPLKSGGIPANFVVRLKDTKN